MPMDDYKGVQFSFEGKRRSSRRKLVRRSFFFFLLTLIILLSVHFWQRSRMHRQVKALLSETITPADFRSNLPALWFAPAARTEAKALAWAMEGDGQGSLHFDLIKSRSTFLDSAPILDRLLEKATPDAFCAYAVFLQKHHALSGFYAVLLKQAQYQKVSDEELASGLARIADQPNGEQIRKRIETLNRELGQEEVVVVLDRDNQPLGTWSPARKQLKGLAPGFSITPLAPLFEKGYRQLRLTLSGKLQKHAETHFKNFHGSLVLLGLERGDILAAYSKPLSQDIRDNPALTELYEPGSILKLLTLFTYMDNMGESIFPFTCKGNMPLNGKTFYDWTAHGTIQSAQEAMALSCNLVFANMGLKLGPDRLKKGLSRFFFDRPHPWTDGPFTLATGRTRPVDGQSHQLANLSIGLEEVSTSTYHAALFAGLIAVNGLLPSPRIIASSNSILGLVISRPLSPPLEVHARSIHYLTLQQAMTMAVDHERGTVRRGQNSHLTFAAKTGTAGDSKLGLDAIIIAYFPRQNPRYALAFHLEHGGKAEINGALLLNRYLSTFPLQ